MPTSARSYHHGDLRAALITTGRDLTRHGGPEALQLREVTRAVGVSPNAAYRHFANHAALLGAVAASIQDLMADAMVEQMPPAADDHRSLALARLRGVGCGYIQFAIEERGWFRLAFFPPGHLLRPDGKVPPPLQLLREALDDLVESGALDPAHRTTAEWACWSGVHGFAQLVIYGPLQERPHPELAQLYPAVVDDIIAGAIRQRSTAAPPSRVRS